MDVGSLAGVADSGILAEDITDLLVAVGEALAERQSGLLLSIDELQYLTADQLGAPDRGDPSHEPARPAGRARGAGLPQLPGLAGAARSYAERLFEFPQVGHLNVVAAAEDRMVARLDRNFLLVRFDRLTPKERQCLRAMAELGAGPHRSGDIAGVLGVKVESVAPRRAGLISKGMIYGPAHGDTAFTVPLFDEFLRRAMPRFVR